jgi:myo-inositol 2-dehydrogenase/D-chiro-inositol 1-dehydrogenase
MRVAVIGAGRMGAIRVEDLAVDPRVSEVLVTNRTESKAQDLADRFNATALPWGDPALDSADAFIITTGTDTHVQHLEHLLPLAKPILCEKPIALTLRETAAMMDLAQHTGSALQIGFQRRFDSGLQALRHAVQTGAIGTVYNVTLIAHDHTPSTPPFIAGSGGIFRDMHVHDFDQLRWITGEEITRVFATSAVREHQQYAEFDDADSALIHATTSGGIQAAITGTRHDPAGHDVRVELFGSADSLSAGLNSRTPLHITDGRLDIAVNPYSGFVDRFRAAFREETQAFVSFAGGEIENPCPPDSALESLRVAIACEISVKTGQPVLVADVSTENN